MNVHYDGKARRWTAFNERHGHRFTFVYTPKHASWVNQVEFWFSILERRVLRNRSFANVAEVVERTLGYIDHWNTEEAHPFQLDLPRYKGLPHSNGPRIPCLLPPSTPGKLTARPSGSRNTTACPTYAPASAVSS